MSLLNTYTVNYFILLDLHDMTVQTPIHFDPPESSRKQPLYKWNEWDLRREALQLVKARDKATHSSQTAQSFRRQNAQVQTSTTSSRGGRGRILTRTASKDTCTQTTVTQSDDAERRKKSIVVGLKKGNEVEVEHVLLEDFVANI